MRLRKSLVRMASPTQVFSRAGNLPPTLDGRTVMIPIVAASRVLAVIGVCR